MIVCAIHQPNFFPWLGYFDKIRQADIFIFMDDVAYPKSGSGMGTWTNRVRLAIQGRGAWVKCPVRREPGEQRIREVVIDDRQPWRKKLLRTLEVNYKKAPHYGDAMGVLEPLIHYESDRIADFNIHAVETISKILGVSARFVAQSEQPTRGQGTELLINLTRAVGAEVYLAGGGASGYQIDEMFGPETVQLRHQDFRPLPYGDSARWIPGLSVIDYLMWDGSAISGGATG